VTKKAAVAILVVGWLILCKPWFLDHRVVPWDSKDVFYPFAHFVSESIHSGDSPFWNPYVYAGYPMASDPQSQMFSPIALALMLIPAHPSYHWFDAIELLHLLMGGVGMLLLAIRFGRSPTAALFSAAVFMFGGSAAARMQHVPIIYAYSYFPFALLALEEMLASNRLRWAVAFGLLAGILAAHMNQVAYLLSLVLIGYYVFRALSSGSLRTFVSLHWRSSIVALVIAAGVLAGPLYLVLQFLPVSNRLSIPFEVATTNSMNPMAFLTLVFRNFFGNARPNSAWGPWDPTESLFYVGVLPIVLILRYGMAGGALIDRQIRYFTGVGVVAILYTVGNWTPFYWLAYRVMPGVSFYRRPNDATFVFNIALAVVTGFLIDRFRPGVGKMSRSASWIGALGCLALFAWGIFYAWQQHQLLTRGMGRDMALAIVFVLAALWFWHAVAFARSERIRTNLLLFGFFLLVVDLSVHTVGNRLNAVPDTDFALLMNDATQQDPVAKFLKEESGSPNPEGQIRADITTAGPAWANAPMMLGIQSTQGYNPLRYALVDRVVGVQETFGFTRPFSPLVPGYDSPLLNLLGMKYIASQKPLHDIDPHADETRFPLAQDGKIRIWQNPNVLPRVMAFTEIYIEPDLDRAIDDGVLAQVDYRTTVVLSHLPGTLTGVDMTPNERIRLPGQGEARVRLLGYRNTEVTVEVETQRDAIIELHDPYYFAWLAFVDGQPREILQSNYMFRGVHVKPGEHRIVFRFDPFSWPVIRQTFLRDSTKPGRAP
jgi:Bacterial membrane protein YfhO